MQPASLWRRALAFAIDFFLMHLLLLFIGRHISVEGIAASKYPLVELPGLSIRLRADMAAFAELFGLYAWFLVSERLLASGSPGKKLAGIRLWQPAGGKVLYGKILVRTTFKALLFLLWLPALLWKVFGRPGMPYDRPLALWVVTRAPSASSTAAQPAA
ncbi:MAG: hypothetical protein EOO16_05930 [Chitinophagaceae bacterium]|nr:MAG: hypothetical protein EOO16_05930 [Chitinophagaceae bacterium]